MDSRVASASSLSSASSVGTDAFSALCRTARRLSTSEIGSVGSVSKPSSPSESIDSGGMGGEEACGGSLASLFWASSCLTTGSKRSEADIHATKAARGTKQAVARSGGGAASTLCGERRRKSAH